MIAIQAEYDNKVAAMTKQLEEGTWFHFLIVRIIMNGYIAQQRHVRLEDALVLVRKISIFRFYQDYII